MKGLTVDGRNPARFFLLFLTKVALQEVGAQRRGREASKRPLPEVFPGWLFFSARWPPDPVLSMVLGPPK